MVHPMMMSADMWDVTREDGAVGILHARGLDPWVIDFGSPDKVEGGMRRNLADHIVALSQAIDTVKDTTGQDVHLVGYSQGGMWCYQVAAYRRSKNLASIVAFGSPVDTLAALPMGIPANFGAAAASFMADHVFNRLAIPSWMARTGFQMMDPLKTAKARLDFLRQLHDREALLPREQQRRFLESEGWIAWSGPAISELLKQFIAHNRMMTGGFAISGQMVTLTDITCPILAFVGEVDDIGQPASVRGIRRAAPNTEVYECLIRTGHFGLVVGSRAAHQSWPTVADWVRWISSDGDKPANISLMVEQSAEHTDSGVAFSSRVAHGIGEVSEAALAMARGAAEAVVAANKSMRTLAVETVRTLPRLARLGQLNDHTRISLGRIIDEQAHDAPQGEFLLFDDRVHTYEAVNRRINNVVRGLIDVGCARGPGGCVDGDPAQRPGRHRGVVPVGGDRGADAPRRRPGRTGPARRSDRDHHRSHQPRRGPPIARTGAGARWRRVTRSASARRRRRHRHGEDRPRCRPTARLVPAKSRPGKGFGVHCVQRGRG